MKRTILLLGITLLTSCSLPYMAVDPELKDDGPMSVEGRQPFLAKPQPMFGEFYTSKVKRSWVKGYDIPFLVTFSGASQKMSFEQFDKSGHRSLVMTANELRSIRWDIPGRGWGEIEFNRKDNFTGVIIDHNKEVWEFIIQGTNSGDARQVDGWVKGPDFSYRVEGQSVFEGKKDYGQVIILGYLVYKGSQQVAAVDVNKGSVWLSSELDPIERNALAGLASSLLVRQDINREEQP